MDIAPPVLFLLRILSEHGVDNFIPHAIAAARRLEQGTLHPAWFSPGVFIAPLQTPTLAPATTTNTVIIGTDRLFVIDPATPDQGEQERLFEEMDRLINTGCRFEAILLTHHHPDHTGAVNALSQRYRLPVRAHKICLERITTGFLAGQPLHDGDRISLGTAPDGSDDWQLEVLHTPGHALDHLCFLESRYHTAVVGDMVSTLSTILIDPPEGHMRTYLDQLERLKSRPIRTLIPAHGPPARDGQALIERFLKHRKERETAIVDALEAVSQDIDSILFKVYDDVPESAYPVASRSLLAGLIKLEEDGICTKTGNGWCLTRP